jgi:hypothetical protein
MKPEDMPYCGDKDLLTKYEHINATIKFLASEHLLLYFLDVLVIQHYVRKTKEIRILLWSNLHSRPIFKYLEA